MSITEGVKRLKFLWRWYILYNVRLIRMHADLPKNLEITAPNPSEAEALDKRRREAQLEIFKRTAKYGELCAGCGRCCLESIDRYTEFDWYIHGSLSRRLESYDGKIYDPAWMLSSGIKRAINRYTGRGEEPHPCRYLSPEGCTIDKEMRPMLCASWFCPTYIRKFSPEDMDKLEAPLREIESIHRDIFRSIMDRGVSGP